MLFHSKKIYFLAVSYAFILFFGFFGLFCFHKVSYASFLVLNVSSTCLLLLLASYPFLLFFIYLCQMPSQYPDMWCSSSGVAKMSIAQNISVLCKRLTPLLAVLISSECTRARRGIPVAELLKWVLRRISVLCTKGLPRYWQCWSLQGAPVAWIGVPVRGFIPAVWGYPDMWCSSSGVAKMSIVQNISALCKRLTPLLAIQTFSEHAWARRSIPVAGLLKLALRRISVLCAKGLPRYWQCWSLQSAPERGKVFQ